jgi:hypothetical protein
MQSAVVSSYGFAQNAAPKTMTGANSVLYVDYKMASSQIPVSFTVQSGIVLQNK